MHEYRGSGNYEGRDELACVCTLHDLRRSSPFHFSSAEVGGRLCYV